MDDLKFIFSQAEKRLDDSIKNYDATTSKSISLISLSTTLLTALSAYFFLNFDPSGVFNIKLCAVFCCCVYTSYVLYNLAIIILPRNYQPIGSYPQQLYCEKYFTDEIKNYDWTANAPTMYLYLNEIKNYNSRLIDNSESNQARLKVFNKATRMICYLPAVGIGIYFLLLSLSLLFTTSL